MTADGLEDLRGLRELARLCGVETSHRDGLGRFVEAAPETLVAVLRALGEPLDHLSEAPDALREHRLDLARRVMEPVVVAWDGRAPAVELRFGLGSGLLACRFDLEGGARLAWDRKLSVLPVTAPAAGSSEPGRLLSLPDHLPTGFHRLRVECGGRSGEALVISAPKRMYSGDGRPLWGVFLPLYSLHSRESWGAGDFSDLERLAKWTAGLGGGMVATLPMLASFLDEPFDPSPYAPASRLFWNELYVDPRRVPELEESAEAQRLLESAGFRREVEELSADWTVDYGRLMSLKRRALEELARQFFLRPAPGRRDAFREFRESRKELETYASFRAVVERRGEPWQRWPARQRDGLLAPADWDEDDRRYHLWVQWVAEEQMSALADEARRQGPGLYLDLPLGAHGSSFDAWRHPHLFAPEVAAGAPPDTLFRRGQNWGFPPLHPERLREHGYGYLIECLRHHLRHAGVLRIDHVMQLYRLYWVPRGAEATAGAYVRYPMEELLAVLSAESHRHRSILVGEDLGTVPPEIGEAMERHDLLGMHVLQYELQPDGERLLPEPPARSVACLNTHDMPTFRGFWEGRDVADLEDLGLFDERQAAEERERRGRIRQRLGGDGEAGALNRALDHLAASPARMVLVNLEDLWGETEPQNVPGTLTERPNWLRKARYPFEEFSTKPEVVDTLRRVDAIRTVRKTRKKGEP